MRRYLASWAAALLALSALACQSAKPGPVRVDRILEPLPESAPWIPGTTDLAAARVAAAGLANRPQALAAGLAELEAESALASPMTEDLRPLARDLANSTQHEYGAYRDASKKLLRDYDADPVLEARLEEVIADDPLRLANRRRRDHYEIYWARTFNLVSEAAGNSILSGFALAPFQLATSGIHYVASFIGADPLSLQGRQALTHRMSFLRRHPDSPKATAIEKKVAKDEEKLRRTHRNHLVRGAKKALGNHDPRAARALALRALEYAPDDPKVEKLISRANRSIETREAMYALSLRASPEALPDLADPEASRLSERLLLPGPPPLEEVREFARSHRTGPLSDEAQYLLAWTHYRVGSEDESWKRLESLRRGPTRKNNMARVASALIDSPTQNPYRAFQNRLRRGRRNLIAWRIFDQWAFRPRYPNLSRPLAYAIDGMAIAQTAMMAPFRWIFTPFQKLNFQRDTALSAYEYLSLHPDGEHADEMIEWLYKFEAKRENWLAALRLADFHRDFDPRERIELAEKAASQKLEYASKATKRDQRHQLLKEVVREFPDATAAEVAGYNARKELRTAGAQRIRMTRDFLKENPRVAGEQGLGLADYLIDGDIKNGELHGDGVSFIGARTLEFALLSDGGEDEPARPVRRAVSGERLARLVALLEETSMTNSRIDRDELLSADANRDYYFERARLELTEEPDNRPTAESTYVYQSLRERYGMVRSRESILPFDLVLRGSFSDMSLGAFPRWRYPKRTPDAFLYK